jgi:hypothetical protein
LVLACPAYAQSPRLEFTRLIAHWDAYGQRDAYLSFVADAQPEVAQVGFYGAHFWSLAHTPHGSGYPAHFPVQGLNECGKWFEDLNRELHGKNVKVVGHFNVKFLVGDPDSPEGPRGFFKYYRDLWDERELGKKPVADPLELLEKDAAGKPMSNGMYGIGGMKEYWACLNNPAWRAVLKSWTKRGIERGADGFIANYFYRHDCHCEHCVAGFKKYLAERYEPEQLKAKYQIENLASHKFAEIVAWHDPAQSTPLRREMLRWSQIANKQAFDEVFFEYGRKLKPDLIAAQWNHLGDFGQISGDERCLLPAEHWGRGEDYLWYSTGGAACFTDLPEGILGEGTLQARYIRGAFDDKPYTLGKYESTRIRSAIAELAANGGAPMGFYTRFTDPAAREEIVRYYQFLKKNDAIYRGNRAVSEALLVFPRTSIHNGDLKPLERFKKLGQELLNAHVLFDVKPDGIVTPQVSGLYQMTIDPTKDEKLPNLAVLRNHFAAPQTVRVSASQPPDRAALHIHFVNYNRTEPAEKRSPGGGIVDEKPIAAPEIACSVVLPEKWTAAQVRFLTPEKPEPVEVPATLDKGVLKFTTPGFLVYGVAELSPMP